MFSRVKSSGINWCIFIPLNRWSSANLRSFPAHPGLKISLIIPKGSLVLLFFKLLRTFSSSFSFQGSDFLVESSFILDSHSSVFKQYMSISSCFIGLSLSLCLYVLKYKSLRRFGEVTMSPLSSLLAIGGSIETGKNFCLIFQKPICENFPPSAFTSSNCSLIIPALFAAKFLNNDSSVSFNFSSAIFLPIKQLPLSKYLFSSILRLNNPCIVLSPYCLFIPSVILILSKHEWNVLFRFFIKIFALCLKHLLGQKLDDNLSDLFVSS